MGVGARLATFPIFTCPAGVNLPPAGMTPAVVPLIGLSGAPIRLVFVWDVPVNFTGQGVSEVENVLVVMR